MKKLFFVLITLSLLCTGCARRERVESSLVVSACSAEKTGKETRYSFFIAESDAPSEDGKTQSDSKIYSFDATDFADAVTQLEDSCGKADLAHVSIFLGDALYFGESYADDLSAIRSKMKISPLVRTFVAGSPCDKIFESIGKSFDGAADYMETVYQGKHKKILCTMSELFFAANNPLFTASIPVMTVSDSNSLPVVDAALLYSAHSGTAAVVGDDFADYLLCVETFGKTSKPLELTISADGLEVDIVKDFEHRTRVKDFARRYQAMGFDALNAFFFAKKCFPTYSAYLDFAQNATKFEYV